MIVSSILKQKFPDYSYYTLVPKNINQQSFNNRAQILRLNNQAFILYSYNLAVAAIINENVYLLNKEKITATSLKHAKEFLLQFGFPISEENKNNSKKYMYSHYKQFNDIESLILNG